MDNDLSLPRHGTVAADAGQVSRRGFVAAATAAGAAASVLADPVARMAHAAGSDRLKVGLVGCGGRGTGAASQAITADPGVVLWAVADAFADRVQAGASLLGRTVEEKAKADAAFQTRFDCPTERQFAGFRGEVPRKPDWSDMEYCLRNWQYYTWLSGDHIVEQAVHSIDRLVWAMNDEMPVSVNCAAGREVRSDAPKGNNIFDHFTAAFEYADGRHGFHICRHFPGAASDNSDSIVGTRGTATVNGFQNKQQTVVDGATWQSEAPKNDMYQQEHDELFASIRSAKPINDGVWMTNSTAMAIMARMSGYTGQPVTWQQLWESKEDLAPTAWDFSAAPPPSPIAVPGKTKLA